MATTTVGRDAVVARLSALLLTALLLASLALQAGCTERGRRSRAAPTRAVTLAEAARAREATAAEIPETITLRDVDTPQLDYREYALPAGCEVTDSTNRLAVYSQNTLKAYPGTVFGLLDLATGERRTALTSPVLAAREFDAFTPRISDTWMVWEEVSPNEAMEMLNAEWRLYAAPLDTARMRLGKPHLIDEGVTDYKLRPFYAVLGSTVYWTVNMVPSRRQEYVARSGSVVALDLASGKSRELYKSPRNVPTLRLKDGRVVVTEHATADPSTHRQTVRVFDADSGASIDEFDLKNRFAVAHVADYADGWLAWSAFPRDGAEWPSAYLRSPDGVLDLAGVSSIDPMFFGDFAAFESVAASFAGGSTTRRARQIWIANPKQRTRALLLETRDEGGWWQITSSSAPRDTLVLWNDFGPWLEDQPKARTLVRVYRKR